MKVAIIDYGMGNIMSLYGALRYVGVSEIILTAKYEELKEADKLILPGVGSFAKAITNIRNKNLDHWLQEIVITDKKPILGVCLGMQMMGESSTENGKNTGLGFVAGHVTKLNENKIKLPHVGFNQVKVNRNLKLYHNMNGNIDFYFTHSYKMNCQNQINQCTCHYGEDFMASFEMENIAGVQFHPELSQNNGLTLLKNFIELF